ncbi:protein of unknown function [Chryseobacterium taeanense]|uniref:DUF305 domain-containing protein n=1 Tax=Chryseobacterium taeanense TaxID=311334 RepID=A0A1G8FK92_9FLAO|nr:DUF305 domain-containing protein [Chryseobacterium taeanense]SDH82436.1 protein of unknown function [Chryseobacterium taeanense]
MEYKKFSLTILLSSIIMYVIMFLNMDKIEDYYTSITRIYMTLLMVAPMAIIMILMMRKMYTNKRINTGIITVATFVFIIALIGLRSQTPVGDVQYLRAMIPHHSSAIMTSKNASIKDPEVRQLADSIIKSQEREIRQMNNILKRLD